MIVDEISKILQRCIVNTIIEVLFTAYCRIGYAYTAVIFVAEQL